MVVEADQADAKLSAGGVESLEFRMARRARVESDL
jgi:hypothetical protein